MTTQQKIDEVLGSSQFLSDGFDLKLGVFDRIGGFYNPEVQFDDISALIPLALNCEAAQRKGVAAKGGNIASCFGALTTNTAFLERQAVQIRRNFGVPPPQYVARLADRIRDAEAELLN